MCLKIVVGYPAGQLNYTTTALSPSSEKKSGRRKYAGKKKGLQVDIRII